ncbi:MAG: TolC family protein [Bacteroidota bacterium]
MKKLHIILLFMFSSALLCAQTIDYNKIVPPVETRVKNFEDYLVQLAWNNSPKTKILNNEVAIARNNVKLEKQDWMEDVQASFNLNEISLSKLIYGDRLDVPVFFPIYNLTATVRLGTFANRKSKIANEKFKLMIEEEEVNQEKLELRRKVLENYQNHLLANELLDIRTDAEEDANQAFLIVQERFKLGEAEFEEYTKASNAYYSAKELRMEALTEARVSKLKVEELIGVSLEQARKYGPKEGD